MEEQTAAVEAVLEEEVRPSLRAHGGDVALIEVSGGVVRCRLTGRRGQFPPLPELGSRLYLLGRETGANRLTAARQYVAEALAQEPVTVEDVTLTAAGEGRVHLAVFLKYQGTDLAVTLTV